MLSIMTVGLAALIIGVVLYEVNVGKKESQSPWIWALIIGGLFLSIVGSIITIILLSTPPSPQPPP